MPAAAVCGCRCMGECQRGKGGGPERRWGMSTAGYGPQNRGGKCKERGPRELIVAFLLLRRRGAFVFSFFRVSVCLCVSSFPFLSLCSCLQGMLLFLPAAESGSFVLLSVRLSHPPTLFVPSMCMPYVYLHLSPHKTWPSVCPPPPPPPPPPRLLTGPSSLSSSSTFSFFFFFFSSSSSSSSSSSKTYH